MRYAKVQEQLPSNARTGENEEKQTKALFWSLAKRMLSSGFLCVESPCYHEEAQFLRCLGQEPKQAPSKGCDCTRKPAGLWKVLIEISH